ncbi:MAG: hypothetical protein LAQ30_28570 [Acidobacteriia bacterium]|nr:hypothetical protein [Terriglobia bacterium]
MLRSSLLSWLAAAAFAAVLPAQRSIEFEGRYWVPRMTGRVRVEQNGVGTDVDARADLGIPNTNFPEGRFTFQSSGRNRLQFTYTPMDYSGDAAVTRTVIFNGQQYTLGTRVISDLEVKHLQLGWAYQFIRVANGAFKLGTLVEADGFLLNGRLQAPNLNVNEQEEISFGLPTAGLAMDINPHHRVNLYAQASGMRVGDYGYYIGGEAGVKVRPAGPLFLTVGYRAFNLHAQVAPDFARLQLHGPFFGAGLRF